MEEKSLADLNALAGSKVSPSKIIGQYKKPTLAALSSLTKSRDGRERRIREILNDGHQLSSQLKPLAEQAAIDSHDAQTIMDTLPDMMLGADIQISSIVNPKDTGNAKLTYNADDSEVPAVALATLNATVEKLVDENLEINKNLPSWLMDILYKDGSKTVVIIPENAVNDIITQSFSAEAYDKAHRKISSSGVFLKPDPTAKEKYTSENYSAENNKDYQAPDRVAYRNGKISNDVIKAALSKRNFSVEADDAARTIYFDKKATSIRYYDDMGFLMLPCLADTEREVSVNRAFSQEVYSMEDLKTGAGKKRMTANSLIETFYRNPATKRAGIVRLKTRDALNRPSVGEPIVRVIPASAFFPVTLPSNPTVRIGGFIVLGHSGEPISSEDFLSAASGAHVANSQFGNNAHTTIEAVKNATEDPQTGNIMRREDRLRREAFQGALEEQLLGALERGMYGDRFELKYTQEIIDVMFFRQLHNMQTSLVFVPEQYLVYMAHRFDASGRGVSVIQSMRNIISARVALVFGNMMAALRNAVPNLDVKVNLDPDDQTPLSTLGLAAEAIARTRGDYSTLGIFSPDVILDKLGRAGIRLLWEGHEELPNINAEYSDNQASIAKADADTEKMFADLTTQGQGLSPDLLDNAKGPDFAIQVAVNSTLRSRRVKTEQGKANEYLTDFVRKYISNSPKAFKALRDSIMPHAKALREALIALDKIDANEPALTDEAVCSLTVILYAKEVKLSLPEPDTTTLKAKADLIEDYSKYLDAVMPYIIDGSVMSSNLFGPVAATVEELKSVVKGVLMREYMSANNIGQEVLDFVALTDDGRSSFNLAGKVEAYLLGAMKTIIPYIVSSGKMSKGVEDLVAKYKIDINESQTSSDSSGSSDDDTGGSDNDAADGDEIDSMFSQMPGEDGTGDDGETANPEATEPETAPETSGTNADEAVKSGELADTKQATEPEEKPVPSKDGEVE